MRPWRVPYPKFGEGPALERTKDAAERLGLDLAAFGAHAAVIVGSNGKGSTAAMCASLLQQAAPNVGLFTSPHLLDLNERFRFGANDISDDELEHHWSRVVAAIEASGHAPAFGGFEFLFLIAADWFAARDCAFTVWEAGLGGRLDPVRLIQSPQVALTSLDLEHTALLGNTLDAIALEKIAAAPDGAHVYLTPSTAPQGSAQRAAIEAYAGAHGLHLDFTGALEQAPLLGVHQQSNAALAVALATSLTTLTDAQIANGLGATRWHGRLEVLSEAPLTLIDVGHTPEGVSAALKGCRARYGSYDAVLVCGVSIDKDAAAIVSALAPHFSIIICVAAHHKGAPAARIAAHAQVANPNAEIVIAETVIDAHRLALAKAQGRAIYVAGGLFLAAEFKAVHSGRDPTSLVFF